MNLLHGELLAARWARMLCFESFLDARFAEEVAAQRGDELLSVVAYLERRGGWKETDEYRHAGVNICSSVNCKVPGYGPPDRRHRLSTEEFPAKAGEKPKWTLRKVHRTNVVL